MLRPWLPCQALLHLPRLLAQSGEGRRTRGSPPERIGRGRAFRTFRRESGAAGGTA